MTPNIFVYGTLLSLAAHPMGERLRREACLLGAAWIAGRLYRVNSYPGLTEASPAEPSRVYGEVYALEDAAASLAWLDAYEGIVAGQEASSEYARIERAVQLASGEDITAWVYLYQWEAAALEPIPDGRWTPVSLRRR